MATYDNRHWLLSHVRNSFISTDDTGMCELVMLGEDLPRLLRQARRRRSDSDSDCEPERVTDFDCYPEMDLSDDDDHLDPLAESYDLQHDMDFGIHRQRSNTAQRLEKMEHAQKKAARIKVIKWEGPSNLSDQEKEQLFAKKDLVSKRLPGEERVKKKSMLADQLEKCPFLPQSQYSEYAMYDGAAQFNLPTKSYKIYMTMLPEDHRNYPFTVCVIASAKIKDLIGFTCYKYSIAHPDIILSSVSSYGLFICEDDGEVDLDFPCLDANEACSKYGFTCLGLVDMKSNSSANKPTEIATCSIPEKGGFNVIVIMPEDNKSNDQSLRSRSATFDSKDKSKNLEKTNDVARNMSKNGRSVNRTISSVTFREYPDQTTAVIVDNFPRKTSSMQSDSNSAPYSYDFDSKLPSSTSPQLKALDRMKDHERSMEAPLYQSYRVRLVNRVRANTHVLLGISGDKIEIDPMINISHFWSRMKPVTYNIDCIAACEVSEAKSSRSTFRLTCSKALMARMFKGFNSSSQTGTANSAQVQTPGNPNISMFKHFYFESDHTTAKEIVEKVNIILKLKPSVCRKEYKASLERKSNIRQSFNSSKNP